MEIVDGKIMIRCPGCLGANDVIFYRNKDKNVKFVCQFCKNTKEMLLSNYLEIMGRTKESERVKKYENSLVKLTGEENN